MCCFHTSILLIAIVFVIPVHHVCSSSRVLAPSLLSWIHWLFGYVILVSTQIILVSWGLIPLAEINHRWYLILHLLSIIVIVIHMPKFVEISLILLTSLLGLLMIWLLGLLLICVRHRIVN